MDGKQITNKFPLHGTESIYISSGGIQGKCKGQIKGKSLTLESVVTASVTLHTKERWELSQDLKKLTIRTDVENPQLPISVIDPWSEIYTRKWSLLKSGFILAVAHRSASKERFCPIRRLLWSYGDFSPRESMGSQVRCGLKQFLASLHFLSLVGVLLEQCHYKKHPIPSPCADATVLMRR